MINLTIEDRDGSRQHIEAPEDMSLSLMEVLKASGYEIQATCGGMALCATCHVQVLQGPVDYFRATDVELTMLDTLPNAGPDSRLACQIRISEDMDGMIFRICADA